MRYRTIWKFKTPQFLVTLDVAPETMPVDFDDGGELDAAIDRGELAHFSARCRVLCNGLEVGADYLGGCIYETPHDFVTTYRNDYFRDMVRATVNEARTTLAALPKLRK